MKDEFLKMGRTYRLIMSFNDPKLDFDFLKNEYRSLLQSAGQNPGPITSSGIPSVPEVRGIEPTSQLPEIVEVQPLNFATRITDAFEVLLSEFSGNFRFSYWPPYFKKVCGLSGCLPVSSDYLTLIQDFKVISFNETNNKYSMEVLRVKRESRLLDAYEKVNPLMPKILCRRKGIP
jgi:hypothetical protein